MPVNPVRPWSRRQPHPGSRSRLMQPAPVLALALLLGPVDCKRPESGPSSIDQPSDPAVATPPTSTVAPPAPPIPDEARTRWVDDSLRREKRATALGSRFSQALCATARTRQAFDLPAETPLRFSAPGQAAPAEHNGTLTLYRFLTTPALSGTPAELAGRIGAWLADYRAVDTCEVHVHEHTESPTGDHILISSITIAGSGAGQQRLEDHTTIRLSFRATEERLIAMETLEAYRIVGQGVLFAEATEALAGKIAFKDVLISPDVATNRTIADQGGLSVVDINDDGRLDFHISRNGRNHLYMQQPNGQFKEQAAAWGVADPGNTRGAVFADLDGDSDLDLVIANLTLPSTQNHTVKIFEHTGGHFTNVTKQALKAPPRGPYTQVSVADVDGDADLDIFIAGYGDGTSDRPNHIVLADNGTQNVLLINQGSLQFTDEASKRGISGTRWSFAAGFADYDLDGDPDLYVANDFGPNHFYENLGNGIFSDRASEYGVDHPGGGMGVQWMDFDGDGRLDIYLANMFSNAGSRIVRHAAIHAPSVQNALFASTQGNIVYLNRGPSRFEDQTERYGVGNAGWAWGISAFDYDRDGDEDLHVVNGYISSPYEHDY